jgi:phosphate/sulfate permease
MDMIYIVIVGLLFLFAISDLVVGVSNDAVNFLNSAIGAKAARFKVLMVIASLGVLVGAFFSGGMMEVARSGIFHPTQFYFHEIMLLFLAVMISDVLLLDFFNTLGLPTSTTVSLVFELLGAAFLFSIVKIIDNGETISMLSKYINSEKAFAIISAIFLSIAIAFTVGFVVMFLTRILFTFFYERKMRIGGSLFGGISIAVISYFIFLKGMKDVSFIPPYILEWINANVILIMLYITIGLSVLFFLIQIFVKVNVFRIVVFFGTFALAMAFAGNDLVNFIGIPMAGFKSFQIFAESGSSNPELFSMGMLAKPVQTEIGFLLAAGIVMILALWFSKKARSVIATSVNLSKQHDGEEQFGSSQFSRTIVKFFYNTGSFLNSRYLKRSRNAIDSRFMQREQDSKDPNPPAFDMLRAALNLMVASTLIALGTSLKLPLSTTYVTFMVAMGTSLADRAWGRESAVYRVSGVFTVVGGWFLTAFIAFTVSSIIALILWWGDLIAIVIVIPLVFLILYRTHVIHKRSEGEKEEKRKMIANLASGKENLETISFHSIEEVITQTPVLVEDVYNGLKNEDIKIIKSALKKIKELDHSTLAQKTLLNESINSLDEAHLHWGEYFIKVNESLRGITVALAFIAKPSYQHLSNIHHTLNKNQLKDFEFLNAELNQLVKFIKEYIAPNTPSNDYNVLFEYRKMVNEIDKVRINQIQRIKKKESPSRSNLLFLNIVSEIKVIAQLLLEIYQIEKQRIAHKESISKTL